VLRNSDVDANGCVYAYLQAAVVYGGSAIEVGLSKREDRGLIPQVNVAIVIVKRGACVDTILLGFSPVLKGRDAVHVGVAACGVTHCSGCQQTPIKG
jgi:hypothetical protein